MSPKELIELMVVSGIFIVILFVSFVLKGMSRKLVRRLAVFFLLAFAIFYFVRPYWIDIQIEKKIEYIQVHLEERYPGETWSYKKVPHREVGYKHLNPYYIGVIFENEPEVEYQYFARGKDDIIQVGYSIKNDFLSDPLHLE
ncbi:hypothetical protein [Sporosarcina koreensis]|uniref:DUF3139 domain-containing protein n=1 Tax=Sporosarcina koreensis TaxID=334735 RepID=A0ABW0TZZ3_9BACL